MPFFTRTATLAAIVVVAAADSSGAPVTGRMTFVAPSARLPLRSARRVETCGLRMNGGMQEIEFVIHPDGRVEEKVTGVKGKNCQEITKEIEEKLGKVTYTQPTSEMFEEEITLTTKDVQKNTLSPGGSSPNSGNKWTQF